MTAASASVRLWTPTDGIQWYLTSLVSPAALTPLVGVDAEALHGAVVRGDAARAEEVHQHVHRLRSLRHKVENAARLLAERDRVRLEGVDDVGELDGVADEKDTEVVSHEIPVAVFGVELDGETAGVACGLGRVASTDDGGEADREVGALAGLVEKLGAGESGDGLVAPLAGGLEVTEGDGAAGVDNALRDALAVEVADLLEELVVLEGRGTAVADRARVLVVVDLMTLTVGQDLAVVTVGGRL
jgi:hypothetical protein